jgi:hypothetical protein
MNSGVWLLEIRFSFYRISRYNPEYGQALRFILSSEARIDEVFHLRSGRVFLVEGKMELPGKSGKTRRIRVLRKETLFDMLPSNHQHLTKTPRHRTLQLLKFR